jgi:hypothetical protein
MMKIVLQPTLGKFAMVYIDDISIYSRALEEHLSQVRAVLQLLHEHKLYA